MQPRQLSWVADAASGELVTAQALTPDDPLVGPGVVIDSRQATAGALFVALPGEHVDGHHYLEQAAAKGAAAALVSRRVDSGLPQVLVEDGIHGLTELAKAVVAQAHRDGLQVLAITGSSGKTSTKDMLAQLLEPSGATISPVGSFNNEIGVPLTACQVDEGTRFLISEMGARGLGHIAWLCDIVRPDISLVLNVGTAHLGEFGSVDGIAQAKGEIVEGLPEGGWAVLNHGDEKVRAMASRTRARIAWFDASGEELPHDAALAVTAHELEANELQQYSFTMVVRRDGAQSEHRVALPLLGRHQVDNAVAAAAAAIAAGISPAEAARRLGGLGHRSRWRMELDVRADDVAVINDAYNANPDSMRAALSALAQIGTARRAAHPGAEVHAVLGDMLELGEESERLHLELGAQAAKAGVDRLWAIGEHAEQIARGARERGSAAEVTTVEEASSLVLGRGSVILVKASRGLALERVAEALLAGGTSPTTSSEDSDVNQPQEPRA